MKTLKMELSGNRYMIKSLTFGNSNTTVKYISGPSGNRTGRADNDSIFTWNIQTGALHQTTLSQSECTVIGTPRDGLIAIVGPSRYGHSRTVFNTEGSCFQIEGAGDAYALMSDGSSLITPTSHHEVDGDVGLTAWNLAPLSAPHESSPKHQTTLSMEERGQAAMHELDGTPFRGPQVL